RELVASRATGRFRGGVDISAKPIARLVRLHQDALDYLRARDMVDSTKSAVFGTSYGASVALAVAAQDVQLGATVLAYPAPTQPAGLATLVTAPTLFVNAQADPVSRKALAQFSAVRTDMKVPFELAEFPGTRHDFLSRDLAHYDLPSAEAAWAQIVSFLKRVLMPPPPRPPAPPLRSTAPTPPLATTATKAVPTPAAAASPAPSKASPPSA
ncbi:MAG: dienelactone hydrolase family protein, partial [Thermoplasmata archaeon]